MYYRYGTSGFRYHHSEIESIAEKVGMIMAFLLLQQQTNFGIMITASHNHYLDNGVKIMDQHGNMLCPKMEELLEQLVNGEESYIQNLHYTLDSSVSCSSVLHIGYDSRQSGHDICNLLCKGVAKCKASIKIIIHPLVSTPQIHFLFSSLSDKIGYHSFLNHLANQVCYPAVLDCANGIGANVMENIERGDTIHLVNTSWKLFNKLNHKCSSDYVCSQMKLPVQEGVTDLDGVLCASLDGDADRVVFYYQENEVFHLLNGDAIAALFLTYIYELLNNTVFSEFTEAVDVGFIYTGYTNGACVDYVKDLYEVSSKVNLHCVCTPTGIKHLHEAALKYDVSVYFEQNGHGNVIVNKSIESLNFLSGLFHPNIGDGIVDFYMALYALQELKWSVQDWNKIYSSYPNKMGKIQVQNKAIFVCNEDESKLLSPVEYQEFLEELCEKEQCRTFVRASGTENVVRLYVECKDASKLESIYEILEKELIQEYGFLEFSAKGSQFLQRRLALEDMDNQYFELLGMLSSMDASKVQPEQCKTFFEKLDKQHVILVFQDRKSGKIVASGTLLVEEKILRNFGKVGHIEDIVVHCDYRKYGLGKKMIQCLTALSEQNGCYKTILDCSEENAGFYEKCEYSRKGVAMGKYV